MSRIDDLLAAMTLEEKIGQLTMVSAGLTPLGPALPHEARMDIVHGRVGSVLTMWGVERTREAQRLAKESRLGIPLLVTFDVLHGQRTIFPIPLAETAAFDPKLWEETARAAAAEAAAEGVDVTYAPMLDVSRDPRWGRIAESPGEDPWLCRQVAVAKLRGYQGGSGRFAADRVAATAKHLAAYGASIAGRDYAAIDISERTLHEVYLPPFKAAVDAGVAAIMPAFVSLAGVPMTSNRHLLRDIVRGEWGFSGVMISDYLAVAELVTHGVAADVTEAAALALAASVDIDMVGSVYARGLAPALERGLVRSEWIDEAVRRVLTLKEQLGLFDQRRASFDQQGARDRATDKPPVSTPAARDLARDAARRSIVLLKNANAVLPLSATAKTIAVIGPLADAPREMLGPWPGAGTPESVVSILDGLRAALPNTEVRYAKGVDLAGANVDELAAAQSVARSADLIVLCVGESAEMAGEAASRARLGLPGRQGVLADAMLALGKPVVVLLTSGRPLLVPELIERADAVLATWFLGCEAGPAIADVLTGRWNPNGRLPVTWPLEMGQIPIFYAEGSTGRPPDANNRYTSKYIDLPVEPLFAFGYGLSYTRFSHHNLRLRSDNLSSNDKLIATVDVRNDGERDGEETVFLFTRDIVASVSRPVRELKAYTKVQLAPGENKAVTLTVPVSELAVSDEHFKPVVEPGEFEVYVGPNASPHALLKHAFRVRSMQ